MPAIPSISPSLRNWPTRSSPSPSMSIAPRLTNCFTAWNSWPGQPVRLGQIVHTPSSGRTVGVPHAGHFSGAFGQRRALLALLRLGGGRDHARDHVARAGHDHLVALAHVLAGDVLLVVERGELHRHARHLHRRRAGRTAPCGRCGPRSTSPARAWWWRSSAGTSRRSRRAARARPRRGGAAAPGRRPSPPRRRSRSPATRGAPPTPLQAATTSSRRVAALDVGVHREAVLAQPLERLEVALELDPLQRADRVGPDRQRARRGHARSPAGGSSPRRCCAGSRRWARRRRRAAR